MLNFKLSLPFSDRRDCGLGTKGRGPRNFRKLMKENQVPLQQSDITTILNYLVKFFSNY